MSSEKKSQITPEQAKRFVEATDAQARALVEEQRALDAEASEAVVVPLPGASAGAFIGPQHVEALGYRVRPFYDVDFEWLQQFDHPIYRMMRSMFSEGAEGAEAPEEYVPRGPTAWDLLWMLTHTVEEVEQAVADGSLQPKSRAEFGKLRLYELLELFTAVMQQVRAYWKPVVGHDGDDAPAKEGERKLPPDSSGAPSTG